MAENPLAYLSGGNIKLDRRHDRQALAPADLGCVLQEALQSNRVFRGLHGRDRYFLYLTGMTTGYRAGELASLQPAAFALDDDPPEVRLAAAFTKNKQPAFQPIPPAAAQAIRGYLTDKPAGQAVWPGTWHDGAAEMLRIDLEAAGVAYVVEGPGRTALRRLP